MIDSLSRSRGCLLGLAAGDAVGTTVEFKPRGSFAPMTDMVGGGPFNLRVGEWTDDTSMALCLGHSLVEKSGFDAVDQMERYCRWWKHGYLSSNGRCFDIGNTVSAALARYQRDRQPFAGSTASSAAGNGAIMRLAPVPIFYRNDVALAVRMAVDSSRTTHASPECLLACTVLTHVLISALHGATKHQVLQSTAMLDMTGNARMREIAGATYARKTARDVRGTGYVVDSLEAALWAFASTDNFRDAILAAANLGDDADTTAAICGQIAGAHYGLDGIPLAWRAQVVLRDEILALADQLHLGQR